MADDTKTAARRAKLEARLIDIQAKIARVAGKTEVDEAKVARLKAKEADVERMLKAL